MTLFRPLSAAFRFLCFCCLALLCLCLPQLSAEEVVTHAVTFDLDGKAVPLGDGASYTQQVLDGEAAITPSFEVDSAWTFTGWDLDFSSVSSDLTVTARYVSSHTVTFELGEYGDLLAGELVQEVGEGFRAIEPAISVDEGWAFIGWDRAYHDVIGAVTVTAEYIPADMAGVLEEAKVLPESAQSISEFGSSVSISGDTAVVGNELGDSSKAYVYVRNDGEWSQEAILEGSDDVDLFGGAVGISGDTIVVSGLSYDDSRNIFYVYVRENGVWSEQAQLTNNGLSRHDYSRSAVAISGNTIVVGMGHDGNGSAFVYERMNGRWKEQAKLVARGGAPTGKFGYSVDICGETIVVGAVLVSGNTSSSGDAYVFRREDGVWNQEARLEPIDGFSHDRFGRSVSVSGDIAVVGAYLDSGSAKYAGAAHVYRRIDGEWNEEVKLRASDGDSYDHFGYSVSVAGGLIAVGARVDEYNGRSSGSAYVYRLAGGEWVEQAKLLARDGDEDDEFGVSVGVSGDTAVVGAWRDEEMSYYGGAAYFYDLGVPPVAVEFHVGAHGQHTGGSLTQTVKAGTSAVAPFFEVDENWLFIGWDTDFSSVESDLVVTAEYVPTHFVTFDTGSYGSVLTGGLVQEVGEGYSAIAPEITTVSGWGFIGWNRNYDSVTESFTVTAQYAPAGLVGVLQEQVLLTTGGVDSETIQGPVSLSGDAAVVAMYGTAVTSWQRSVSVYVRSGGVWREQAKLVPSKNVGSFGTSVSVSGDTIVVGAEQDHAAGSQSGSAYVYRRSGAVWVEQGKLIPSDGEDGDEFGSSVSVSGDTIVVGANGDYHSSIGGRAYVYTRNGGVWTEQEKLVPSDGLAEYSYGIEVSVSGDTVVVGGLNTYTSKNRGVYIYVRNEGAWTEQAKLLGDDENDFGSSVDVIDNVNAGSAYVYARSGGAWSEEAKLVASDGAESDYFGSLVSVSGDRIVVGASGLDRVYVYARRDGIWFEEAKRLSSTGHVSLSGDMAVVSSTFWDNDGPVESVSVHDLGVPPVAVAFNLDGKSSHMGGGALSQLVKVNTPAIESVITPNTGWMFDAWDSDFSSVTFDMTVTALYSDSTTSDGDSLWDGWEQKYLGGTGVSDGSIDSDGDGDIDEAEFKSGNDPMDRSDYFHVMEEAVSPVDGKVTLRFTTNDDVGSRRYRICYTDDLSTTEPWPPLPMGEFAPDAGDSTEKTFDAPGAGDAYFFKVEAFIEE
jgi:hypothetical protein